MVLRIKEIRERTDLAQRDLAKAVGCTNAAVCRWESGSTLPTVDKLPLIARALDCTIDALFCGRDNSIVPQTEG